jgi:hypothetical protein
MGDKDWISACAGMKRKHLPGKPAATIVTDGGPALLYHYLIDSDQEVVDDSDYRFSQGQDKSAAGNRKR